MSELQAVVVPRELYYHEVAYVRGLEAALTRIARECVELADDPKCPPGDRAAYEALEEVAANALNHKP